MESDRLITIAIHTLDKAQALKALLEREGVAVTLQNVNLSAPVVAAGVRVRIFERDLPLALRIVENPEIFSVETPVNSNETPLILVPVDFSEKSMRAICVAFDIAASMGAKVVVLHSFLVPHVNPLTSLGQSVTLDMTDIEAENVNASVLIAKAARSEMHKLQQQLRGEIKHGALAPVKFSTELLEGVPEESIDRYVKEHPRVRLLVMGTRSAEKKAADLAGSITAEVLDSCRVQALTVPESVGSFKSLKSVRRVALLSHLEQEDFLALDALNRLLPKDAEPGVAIKVICMPNDKYSAATNNAARIALSDYCAQHFPGYEFTLVEHKKNSPDLEIGTVDLVVVPNRKKNIFARLFNPGAAHRILFHTDVPLLVIPV